MKPPMTSIQPKALIFDFGGVISRTLFETHRETEQALGLSKHSLQWRGPFDVENDDLWRRMQADDITERDYWKMRTQEVSDLTDNNWTKMSDFVKAARGAHPQLVIRPEFMETIKIAKAHNIRLAILSNELDLFYGEAFRAKLPFLTEFETITDATYTKILKPDPRAYQICLDALKLAPSECVFIDDQLRNIHGSLAHGLISVHFDVQNPSSSYAEALAHFGLDLPETYTSKKDTTEKTLKGSAQC